MNRRIFILYVFIFSASTFTGYGQEAKKAPEPQRFSIGFKLGPSVTLATYPDKELRDRFSSRPKQGFGGAGLIIFPLGSKTEYTFFAEGGYAIRGRRVKIKGDNIINDGTYQFAEMSMGLRKSFDLKIKKYIPSKWFINVGPNIQYWVSGKGKLSETKYNIVFNQEPNGDLFTNFINKPNRWFFGIDVGVGTDAPISKRQTVRLELRITSGQTFLGKKESTSNLASLSWDDSLRANLKTVSVTGSYTLDFDMRARKLGRSTKDKEVKRKRKK